MGLLKQFAGSLNEEQMFKLLGDLNDEQKQQFIELYSVLVEQHKREQEMAAAAAAAGVGGQGGHQSAESEAQMSGVGTNNTSG